jgi:hypothetical protein
MQAVMQRNALKHSKKLMKTIITLPEYTQQQIDLGKRWQ